MSPSFTSSIDLAQVVLYAFWIFFFGLIFWIRKEDRREGYPLESDNPRNISNRGVILLPAPKTFMLPEGGTYTVPNDTRDERAMSASRSSPSAGAPLVPTGEALLSAVGPASFANRHDHPELTFDGHDAIVPLRVAEGFEHAAGPDPRGWTVRAADGKSAGEVKDIWVDRAEATVRYLEIELTDAGTRLLPITNALVRRGERVVDVEAVKSHQLAMVPELKTPEQVTLLEEEKICAFFAGARLYADPKRLGPIV